VHRAVGRRGLENTSSKLRQHLLKEAQWRHRGRRDDSAQGVERICLFSKLEYSFVLFCLPHEPRSEPRQPADEHNEETRREGIQCPRVSELAFWGRGPAHKASLDILQNSVRRGACWFVDKEKTVVLHYLRISFSFSVISNPSLMPRSGTKVSTGVSRRRTRCARSA